MENLWKTYEHLKNLEVFSSLSAIHLQAWLPSTPAPQTVKAWHIGSGTRARERKTYAGRLQLRYVSNGSSAELWQRRGLWALCRTDRL